jgi:CRISPR-associated endonuclease/helicase Cas3
MRKGDLLAKSYDSKKGHTPVFALLINHTRDVADAGNALLKAIGARALSNAGMTEPEWWERLSQSSQLGFWLHDIGKANEHFHLMVEGSRELVQLLRHEVISVLLATREPIRSWLSDSGYDEQLLYPALWSVAGHHRKFCKTIRPAVTSRAEVYVDHRDFHAILSEMSSRLEFKPETSLATVLKGLSLPLKIDTDGGPPCDIVADEALIELTLDWKRWAERRKEINFDRLVAIQKSITIAADVCGSAFARTIDASEGKPIADFVAESLDAGLTPLDLDELMFRYAWERTDKRLSRPENPHGFPKGFKFHDFQREVAELDSDKPPESMLTFAVAGCGSGKSLAAYLWAKRWCQAWADEGRTNFRLFFTLPTTGTATEHFKDYGLACGVSPKLKGLAHSRSSVDLTFVAEETAPQEEGNSQSNKSKQAEEMLKAQSVKIESLDLWGTPLVISTVDTVLGLMANARRSVYSFPAIMQSAIVFDEIHAYDDQLFGHLLIFLETFPKIPVLLMTASLPEVRLKAIDAVRTDLRIVKGPREHEVRRRYASPILRDDEDVWGRIRACLKDPLRGKVLWVRNQVDWAVQSYQHCHKKLRGINPYIGLYHSRFRYKDRVEVHSNVIKHFKEKGRPCVLVATQVAEMSLDLSADLLISDFAPIPALIQRLGRLNRFATTNDGPSGASIFCEPPISEKTNLRSSAPYTDNELAQARLWLSRLMKGKKRLSQRHLSAAFSGFESGRPVDLQTARQRAVFVSGMWETYPGSTRGDGYTMPVILRDDYEHYPKDKLKDFRFRRDWLREHEVSIPIRDEIRRWEIFSRTPIAPSNAVKYGHINADDLAERTGASWTDHRSVIV